jgi:hypothetical protein
MSMYVVVLSDIKLGLIESLHMGTTLSSALTGALLIPAALTLTKDSLGWVWLQLLFSR